MRFFAAVAFLFAAPLFAQGDCTYSVSLLNVRVPAARSNFTITVSQTAGSKCDPFTVAPTVTWLHAPSGIVSFTSGDILFTADENLSASGRTGAIRIANQNVNVTQDGANCIFGMDFTSHTFPVGGGSNSFTVKATCAWAASPSAPWIRIAPGNQGASSSATLNFNVDRNLCVYPRSGNISFLTGTVAPPVFAIVQEGSQDNLTLSATSATVSAAAADTRIKLTTGDGCGWSVSSDVSWLQITTGSSGAGNGGFTYHLLENASVERTGNIHVGALTYTVTQHAPAGPALVLTAVAGAANYATDAVSPGEIVALFGANMGPSSMVILQVDGARVTNNLAGTQVFFDGVAAPMIYTRADQLSAVVPYGVAAATSTKVQVQYQGMASNTLTIPVQAATPAIFSMDATGTGPGAILNQDNSLNASANPAARGSIVAIYLTGGGVTTPVSSDGAVTGAPPQLLAQAVTVTVDGVPAVVKYAGAAPQAVAGLTQINVEVPAGVANGLGLPVIVKVGNFASTGTATIAVK